MTRGQRQAVSCSLPWRRILPLILLAVVAVLVSGCLEGVGAGRSAEGSRLSAPAQDGRSAGEAAAGVTDVEATATAEPTSTPVPTADPTSTRTPTPNPASTALPTGPTTGALAPDLTLPDLNGNPVTLSDLRGKMVLLNFWATW